MGTNDEYDEVLRLQRVLEALRASRDKAEEEGRPTRVLELRISDVQDGLRRLARG